MDPEDITLKLPPEPIAELVARGAARDVTPGQLVREHLRREFARSPTTRSNRADEQLVAGLQRLLAPMPGHPHRMRHLLNEKAAGVAPDGPIGLIEPF